MKILVVDDDADVRRLAATALRLEGFLVLEAPDGATARRLVSEASAVVMDRVLPDDDGLCILEDLGRLSALNERPRFLLTASLSEEDEARALASGAEVLAKPFDPYVFGRRVREIVTGWQGRSPAAQ